MGKKTQKKGLVKCMKNDLRNIEQEGGRREGEGQRKGRGGAGIGRRGNGVRVLEPDPHS